MLNNESKLNEINEKSKNQRNSTNTNFNNNSYSNPRGNSNQSFSNNQLLVNAVLNDVVPDKLDFRKLNKKISNKNLADNNIKDKEILKETDILRLSENSKFNISKNIDKINKYNLSNYTHNPDYNKDSVTKKLISKIKIENLNNNNKENIDSIRENIKEGGNNKVAYFNILNNKNFPFNNTMSKTLVYPTSKTSMYELGASKKQSNSRASNLYSKTYNNTNSEYMIVQSSKNLSFYRLSEKNSKDNVSSFSKLPFDELNTNNINNLKLDSNNNISNKIVSKFISKRKSNDRDIDLKNPRSKQSNSKLKFIIFI
jgi:hypothetical protein